MKISEIFFSIQGEGREQGKPCMFVRCAGCNLDCHWCDTGYARSGGTELSTDEILEHIWRVNPRRVCITGGEPLLQEDAILPLLHSLHSRAIAVTIETNGTLDFSRAKKYASICMDVKCPSSGEESDLSLLSGIRECDSVKFVVADEEDCSFALEVMNARTIKGDIFFSPVFGTDCQPIVRFILKHNMPVRFQIQLHRLIGVK